jgi:dipeptidyl aminopeptidase/acylaminoacyl peptidase
VSPDAKSYDYLLLDLEEGRITPLGRFHFRQSHAGKLADTREVTIPARDGVPLPSLLMLPPGAEGPGAADRRGAWRTRVSPKLGL